MLLSIIVSRVTSRVAPSAYVAVTFTPAVSPGAFMRISEGSSASCLTVSFAGSPNGTPCAIQL